MWPHPGHRRYAQGDGRRPVSLAESEDATVPRPATSVSICEPDMLTLERLNFARQESPPAPVGGAGLAVWQRRTALPKTDPAGWQGKLP